MSQRLWGLEVIENSLLTEKRTMQTTRVRKRSLWERLFTRPWEPALKYVDEPISTTVVVPSENILQFGNTLIAHPQMVARMREEFALDRSVGSRSVGGLL